jgi:fatty aldehyde-generating acyl-ACP reductase
LEKFAFIMHPLDAKRDIARKFPAARFLPESILEWMLKYKSPFEVSHITGVKSPTGEEAEGWFIGCPLTPKQMHSLPPKFVAKRIIESGKIAEQLGAKIIGLGAHTSVVGDGGITVAKNLNIAVTTGNSYTIATAIEGSIKAAEMMDIDPSKATLAIVGAAGSIGRTCGLIMARTIPEINLIGRNLEPLHKVSKDITDNSDAVVRVYTDIYTGISNADIVITVTSSLDTIIEPKDLKSGAVVCDVARPRDVSALVAKQRNDVLVIDGGVVAVPGDVDFNFNFGFPPKTAYACMSETMILTLEKRYENFTIGKEINVSQVDEISALAQKHRFKLAGFRGFEKAISDEHITRIKKNVRRK